MSPDVTTVPYNDTHRLIPSRYPPVGILDLVSSADDLALVQELEGWTNDRISTELGILHTIPEEEWVIGTPNATAIMASFCHPPVGGYRFTKSRGAWYAAVEQETAIRETVYHRTKELLEIGVLETSVQMRAYLADFDCSFHDVRPSPAFDDCHDPDSYHAGQALGEELLRNGSNGVVYRSVRHEGGECIACFRPPLVLNVRQGTHLEYVWEGSPEPTVRTLP